MPRQAPPEPGRYERIASLAAEIFDEWSSDNAPRLAASLAYYSILSAAPLLVVSIALADLLFGGEAVRGQLAWEIQTFVGGEASRAIQSVLSNAHRPSSGFIATMVSLGTLVIGASSVVIELHSALNLIWRVPQRDSGSWIVNVLAFLKQRFYSALVVLAAGCLLLISLMVSVFITTVGNFFRTLLPLPEWTLHLASFGLSLIVVTLVFAAIYKLLPDVRLRWGDVIIGASVTSLLFTIGKQALAIYLGHVAFQSTYGAAWTVVLLLVWVYYSAQLFFLGAEFTKVYARRYGSRRHGSAVASRDNSSKAT